MSSCASRRTSAVMNSRRGRQRSVVAGLAMTVAIVLLAAGAPVGPASGASTCRTVAPVSPAAASAPEHGQVQAPAGLRGVIATAGNYGHSLALRADGAAFAGVPTTSASSVTGLAPSDSLRCVSSHPRPDPPSDN